eukprot:5967113-Pleurochrysis_carterae.AAC.1
MEPDSSMLWDGTQGDLMEEAPIRPKVFFGEPDPAARAGPRQPTRFEDPLSPPPPRPLPLRRLPSPEPSRE